MMMKMKSVFGMWSLAIHRAYREDSDLSLFGRICDIVEIAVLWLICPMEENLQLFY